MAIDAEATGRNAAHEQIIDCQPKTYRARYDRKAGFDRISFRYDSGKTAAMLFHSLAVCAGVSADLRIAGGNSSSATGATKFRRFAALLRRRERSRRNRNLLNGEGRLQR